MPLLLTVPRTEALLALRGAGQLPVGRDRIAMLEAVGAHGSITAAAKALGYSYKAVWDGLNAVNNLLPAPALLAQSGGRGGGGATLTDRRARLIAAFRRLEAKLTEISAAIGRDECRCADRPAVLERGDENQRPQRPALPGDRHHPRRGQRRSGHCASPRQQHRRA